MMTNRKFQRWLFVMTAAATGSSACLKGAEPAAEEGITLHSLSAEKGAAGVFVYRQVRYAFESTYRGGVIKATVGREGQPPLVEVEKRDGQTAVVSFAGQKAEKNLPAERTESLTGPIADLVRSVDGQALKLLALETTCVDQGAQTKKLRMALQLPLYDLQRYGSTVQPSDLKEISGRCNLKCNQLTSNGDMLLSCGGPAGAARPVAEISHKNSGAKFTYLSGSDCFGACGAGCIGCNISDQCDGRGGGSRVYECYTRECCQTHDQCLAEAGDSYISDAAMVCNRAAAPNCSLWTAIGADPRRGDSMMYWSEPGAEFCHSGGSDPDSPASGGLTPEECAGFGETWQCGHWGT